MSPVIDFHRKPGRDYFALIKKFPLTSIDSAAHFRAACAMLDSLLALSKLSHGQEAYLEVLTDLMGLYEDEIVEIPDASDAEILEHLLDARGESQSDLARATKIAKSTICTVMSGSRKLTRSQIAILAGHFKVEPSVFIHKNAKRTKSTRAKAF